jgi:biopolymer transport protein ExbD
MSSFTLTPDSPYSGLFPKPARHGDAEFDITAMIDLVFMMNIYFLVTFITGAAGQNYLPVAAHAVPLDSDKAAIITILAGPDWKTVYVYLGDGKQGTALGEPDDQATQIASYVDRAAATGKTAVLLKADKTIRLREIRRISAAATREGMTLHIAIMEKDQ